MRRTILVTGSTDGLGKGVAADLAAQGHTVLVHGRDPARVDAAVRETGAARGYTADLSSLAAVRRLAAEVLERERRLDVLVNNAATGSRERALSADGHELTFAVNHLAHFLLTHLLLPLLERSAPARIVNVTSAGHFPIDFDELIGERGYNGVRAYAMSKIAQIMFTLDLAERLGESGVAVNAVHPAILMDTKMTLAAYGRALTTVADGVRPTVRVAVAPELEGVTGRYFEGLREDRAGEQAYDARVRARLWEICERLTAEHAAA